jgi:D-3-phosphoglycerate dehydrogenase
VPTKIVVTDYLEPNFDWEKEQLRSRQFDFAWQEHQLKFAPADDLVRAIGDADVVVVNMAAMNADVIGRLPKCKLIIRHGIGYDNVDLKAATAKGIRVANIPDYCPEEVAEQAVMLIFAAARHLPEQLVSMTASMAKGTWDFSPVRSVYMMEGKTLGLVGCGRIGRRVYRLASGFGMRRLVCDPYLSEEDRRELGLEKTVSLETLLRESDIVSLHTPLNDETRGTINARTLAMMKRTAVLVNTARGPLIVDEDLADALAKGVIAGAAIDVYHREPPARETPLAKAPNLLMTPHLAWYSEESGWSIREKILENIVRYFEGKPPRYTVNKDVEKVLAAGK